MRDEAYLLAEIDAAKQRLNNATQKADALEATTSILDDEAEMKKRLQAVHIYENDLLPLLSNDRTTFINVVTPKGLTQIIQYLYYNATAMETLVVSEGVETIQNRAFHRCTSLTTVSLPTTLKAISVSAFQACTALISIVIPEGVTAIEANAFAGCTALESATLPSTLTSIASNAFAVIPSTCVYTVNLPYLDFLDIVKTPHGMENGTHFYCTDAVCWVSGGTLKFKEWL